MIETLQAESNQFFVWLFDDSPSEAQLGSVKWQNDK